MASKWLSFEDLCAILAFHEYEGIRWSVLGRMLGMGSKWASSAFRYSNAEVWNELQRLGAEGLYRKYVTVRHQHLLDRNLEKRTS